MDFVGIDREEATELMHLDLHSRETYALMQAAWTCAAPPAGPWRQNEWHGPAGGPGGRLVQQVLGLCGQKGRRHAGHQTVYGSASGKGATPG